VICVHQRYQHDGGVMCDCYCYSHSTVTTDKELGFDCVTGGSSFFFEGCASPLRGILDEFVLECTLLADGGRVGGTNGSKFGERDLMLDKPSIERRRRCRRRI
jgi:hypothetical protein